MKINGITIYHSPHVCTVEDTCAYASKCFPDAKTINFKGNIYGYSKSQKTMIVTSFDGMLTLERNFNQIIKILAH